MPQLKKGHLLQFTPKVLVANSDAARTLHYEPRVGRAGKSYTLTAEDPALARFLVRAGPSTRGRITRVTLDEPTTHAVSAAGVTHRLAHSSSPGAGMTLETIAVDDAESGERWMLPAEIEWSYMEWAEGSRAEAGGNLLASLPDGDYWLVRTKLPARSPGKLLLGNERIASPPNALELVDERPLYAAAIGARPEAPPSGKTPLVGLAVLDYVGDAVMDAVLFFELVRSASAGAPPKDADADAVVIVPAGGDLVIDVLEVLSPARSVEAKDRWRTTRAPALVQRLARRTR